MLLFYSNVSNFTQNVIKDFCLAQIWWRLLKLPHDSSLLKGSVFFAIRGKKNRKLSQTILPFWLLFCRWFGYYFALVWKIDTTLLVCECSCILCPNVENFWPNNGQCFSFGDATASPCCTLMPLVKKNNAFNIFVNYTE